MTARKPRRGPVVTAAFAASWDGRLLEVQRPRAGREGFPGSPVQFRKLLAEGLLDEVSIAWRPCIGGGAPITGPGSKYLPRGIVLELVKLERRGDECVARYRVQHASE